MSLARTNGSSLLKKFRAVLGSNGPIRHVNSSDGSGQTVDEELDLDMNEWSYKGSAGPSAQ